MALPELEVLEERVFAAAPVISSDLTSVQPRQVAIRMSYATLRRVRTFDGTVRFQIENRSGEKLFLDADAVCALGVVAREMVPCPL